MDGAQCAGVSVPPSFPRQGRGLPSRSSGFCFPASQKLTDPVRSEGHRSPFSPAPLISCCSFPPLLILRPLGQGPQIPAGTQSWGPPASLCCGHPAVALSHAPWEKPSSGFLPRTLGHEGSQQPGLPRWSKPDPRQPSLCPVWGRHHGITYCWCLRGRRRPRSWLAPCWPTGLQLRQNSGNSVTR